MILLIPLLFACIEDDWDGKPYNPEVTVVVVDDTAAVVLTGDYPLAGDWNSVGDDISPLFSADPFNYVALAVRFSADGTYTATSTDTTGTQYVLAGDYAIDESVVPAAITLWQVDPFEATALGIWEVDADTLTYEVVQTVPDYGFAAPTPEGGFGSTSGPGLTANSNIQVYRR